MEYHLKKINACDHEPFLFFYLLHCSFRFVDNETPIFKKKKKTQQLFLFFLTKKIQS